MDGSSERPSRATAERRRPRRRRIAFAAVAAALVVVAGVVAAETASPSPVEEARRLVRADENFATATEAGVTFTRVSSRLQSAAEACRRSPSSPGDAVRQARCDGLFSGAAYARVSAVAVLRCTRPGVFDARASMRTYLDALASTDDASPPLPPVVRCR